MGNIMIFKSRLYATAAVLAFVALASPASAQTTGTSGNLQLFPPTNAAAGQGLLYFPQGGTASLYAVPVVDPALVTATNNEVTATNTLNATTNTGFANETAAINALAAQLAAINATLAKLDIGTASTTSSTTGGTTASASSSSSSSTSSADTLLPYPSYITCSVGGENTTIAFQGLSNNVYTYIANVLGESGAPSAAYSATTGALLNEIWGGRLGGCPTTLPAPTF